jgi:hypothetical protein
MQPEQSPAFRARAMIRIADSVCTSAPRHLREPPITNRQQRSDGTASSSLFLGRSITRMSIITSDRREVKRKRKEILVMNDELISLTLIGRGNGLIRLDISRAAHVSGHRRLASPPSSAQPPPPKHRRRPDEHRSLASIRHPPAYPRPTGCTVTRLTSADGLSACDAREKQAMRSEDRTFLLLLLLLLFVVRWRLDEIIWGICLVRERRQQASGKQKLTLC